jgi:threonine/homoserine/homoserine lactone efflux protein
MIAWLAALASLALVMSVTPGPNNVLFAASGSRVGFLHSLPILLGMLGGFGAVIAASCLGVGALVGDSPEAQLVLRCLAASYMLWIGAHLWRTAPEPVSLAPARPLSWLTMATLQGINPKTWLASVAFASGFLGLNSPGGRWVDALGILCFLAVVSFSASLWTLLGAAVHNGLSPRRLGAWNRCLAVLSILTAGAMLVGVT